MAVNTETWKKSTVTNGNFVFTVEYDSAKPELTDEVKIRRSLNDISFREVTMPLSVAEELKDALVEVFGLLD